MKSERELDMIKRFVLYVVITYLLTSIAMVLGGGYVIDWVPEASLTQKAAYYIKTELFNHFGVKLMIASVISLCTVAFVKVRTAKR